ncbi:MAG: protoheme IX farnesyltransferase [Chloroflexota bacterium]|nr:protoheme IX farnesyltransferase [Lentimicrobium sp.]
MRYKFLLLLKSVFHLSKAGISFSVALTAVTGYLLSVRYIDNSLIPPFLGVLFLAMAASALNQLQEKETDKLMPRTSNRPLVNGSLTKKFAIFFIATTAITGAGILYIYNGLLPALLGLLNMFWYNGVYTPLKYKTAFAAFPGGIVGAIPPLIGWTAGGGQIQHPLAIALAVFFFIGQIPHFWILILKYSTEYELAGIKSISEKFSVVQIRRLILSWVVATAFSGIILSYYIILNNNESFYIIHVLSLLIIAYFVYWLLQKSNHLSYKAFLSINIYYLLIMVIIAVDILTVH